MDPEVRELVRGWLEWLETNNRSMVDENDIRNYLYAAGFSSESIERTLQTVKYLDKDELKKKSEPEPELKPPSGPPPGEDAETPGELEPQNPKRHEVNFGQSAPALTSFDDMSGSERALYKDVITLVKNKLNNKQRQLLAQEIRRFKGHENS